MLVRRSMEDSVWLVISEDAGDSLAVTNIGDHGHERNVGKVRSQLVQNVEDGVLAMADQNHPGRSQAGNLAAKLTANGAAGPSDQNGFARRQLRHCGKIGFYWLAAKKILDLHLAKAGAIGLGRDQLGQAGNGQ